jgi:hypothetical protein
MASEPVSDGDLARAMASPRPTSSARTSRSPRRRIGHRYASSSPDPGMINSILPRYLSTTAAADPGRMPRRVRRGQPPRPDVRAVPSPSIRPRPPSDFAK